MAKTAKKAKAAKVAEPEFEPQSRAAREAMDKEKDYTTYADKDATDLQSRLNDWILEKTGYEPEDEDSFFAGVRLATALRMDFQASPENQKVLAERRAAKEEAEEEKANAPAKKRGRPKKAKAEEVEEAEDEELEEDEEAEEEETPAPKPKARRAKKAPAAEKKPAVRKAAPRKKSKPVADDDEDAAPY